MGAENNARTKLNEHFSICSLLLLFVDTTQRACVRAYLPYYLRIQGRLALTSFLPIDGRVVQGRQARRWWLPISNPKIDKTL